MKRSLQTILRSGIAAGILDIVGAIIVYALILNVTTAQRVLQTVAAGALGKGAYTGGWNTALAGLGFHFLIAILFAAAYYIIYPYWTKIFSNKWIAGICYGIVVWTIMNLLVVPAATGAAFVFNLKYFLWSIGLIIFCVGIPISIITHSRKSKSI